MMHYMHIVYKLRKGIEAYFTNKSRCANEWINLSDLLIKITHKTRKLHQVHQNNKGRAYEGVSFSSLSLSVDCFSRTSRLFSFSFAALWSPLDTSFSILFFLVFISVISSVSPLVCFAFCSCYFRNHWSSRYMGYFCLAAAAVALLCRLHCANLLHGLHGQ